MPSFISLIFIVCFASLSLWLLFKDQKEIRKYFGTSFGLSFLGYLSYYLLFTGPLGYMKLGIGVLILFVGGFILNAFSNNKIAFVSILGLALFGLWSMPEIPRIPFLFGTETATKNDLSKLDPNFELLVEMKPDKKAAALSAIIKKYNLNYEAAFEVANGTETDLDDYLAVNIPENQTANFDKIVAELQNSGLVDGIEQNEIVQLFQPIKTSKSKPSKGNHVLNDPELDKVWGFEMMKIEELHKLLAEKKLKPAKRAKIAIIDTGIDAHHEDLTANFVSTRVEYDEDYQGHGTHCAGIAAAVSNNRKGVASCFPSSEFVQVTSIQVFPRSGGTTQRIIIRGMILAADSGADVLSMSLGGPSSDQAQRAYKEAVRYANKKGAIVVVAAGNEDIDARQRVPASVEGVITVAAIDQDNKKASFSNTVNKLKMGVAAPGVDVFSSMPDSKYEYMSGTSMATPYVAGLLGLMKSINPTLSTEEAFNILNRTGATTASGTSTGKLIQPQAVILEMLK